MNFRPLVSTNDIFRFSIFLSEQTTDLNEKVILVIMKNLSKSVEFFYDNIGVIKS